MEYSHNNLINLINFKIKNDSFIKEDDILTISLNISIALSQLHYLKPPLIHRDLKIENVLIHHHNNEDKNHEYKLCDFGSTSTIIKSPRNSQDYKILQDNILKTTTKEYRSPEMIDLFKGFEINEKCDIWALGCFIYKLCYFKTPFENLGEYGILNSIFQFPNFDKSKGNGRNYSNKLKNLIVNLLNRNPDERPNIYQVIKEICSMKNIPVPIKNIYSSQLSTQIETETEIPIQTQTQTQITIKIQDNSKSLTNIYNYNNQNKRTFKMNHKNQSTTTLTNIDDDSSISYMKMSSYKLKRIQNNIQTRIDKLNIINNNNNNNHNNNNNNNLTNIKGYKTFNKNQSEPILSLNLKNDIDHGLKNREPPPRPKKPIRLKTFPIIR